MIDPPTAWWNTPSGSSRVELRALATSVAHSRAFAASGSVIFTTVTRGPVHHSAWSDAWRRAAKGELADVGFHALRHFYASTLIRGGCTVKEVQERLGHSSAAMTLDVYSHLFPADEDRTRTVTDDALGDLWSGKCSPDLPQENDRQTEAQVSR
jgi:integrase